MSDEYRDLTSLALSSDDETEPPAAGFEEMALDSSRDTPRRERRRTPRPSSSAPSGAGGAGRGESDAPRRERRRTPRPDSSAPGGAPRRERRRTQGPEASGSSAPRPPSRAARPSRDGGPPADLGLDGRFEYGRLPLDRDPIEETRAREGARATGCFMCDFASYLESNEEATNTGMPGATHEQNRKDAFAELEEEVRRLIARGTNTAQLVEAVWQFYENEVRELCDYGEWTREKIHEHVFAHMRANERLYYDDMHRLYSAQIDFLRKRGTKRNLETGEDEFDYKNFETISKVHRLKMDLFDRVRRLNDQTGS